MKKRSNIINHNKTKNNISKRIENVFIHGSDMIFSKEYINLFNSLNDKTYMYYEEDLLAIRLIKNKLKSVYNPTLKYYIKMIQQLMNLLKQEEIKSYLLLNIK